MVLAWAGLGAVVGAALTGVAAAHLTSSRALLYLLAPGVFVDISLHTPYYPSVATVAVVNAAAYAVLLPCLAAAARAIGRRRATDRRAA